MPYGARKVDEGLWDGCSEVKLPNWNKEAEVERHFTREEHANWKIVCLGNRYEKCGQIRYLHAMNISEVNDVILFWHAAHKKAVYNRATMGNQSYRGTIPAAEDPEEE